VRCCAGKDGKDTENVRLKSLVVILTCLIESLAAQSIACKGLSLKGPVMRWVGR